MRRLLACLVLVLLPLGACGTTGVPTPETANERLVVLEYSYQGALRVAGALAAAGAIPPGEPRQRAVALIEQAGAAVRAARRALAAGGGDGDWLGHVAAANRAVTELVVYLEQRRARS